MTNRDEIKTLVREAVINALAESKLTEIAPGPASYRAPWTGVEYQAHPSRREFNINEAATHPTGLIDFAAPERCTIEKNKSCDHCGMCRSLGF